MNYFQIANELQFRIMRLAVSHPEILNMSDPFDLLKVEGFEYNDLEPSLAQVTFALSNTQALHNTLKMYRAAEKTYHDSRQTIGRMLDQLGYWKQESNKLMDSPSNVYIGFHNCENSPLGCCIYQGYIDGAHDFCIYCGKPEERK